MSCELCDICGGCSFRHLSLIDYQQQKILLVRDILQQIKQRDYLFEAPIFIQDGCRRRASFAFLRKKGRIILGFNALHSKEIIDVVYCPLLTEQINNNLPLLRNLLDKITQIEIRTRGKKKNDKTDKISSGDLWVTEADNGLDVVLEFDVEPNLEMRQIIFEMMQGQDSIIRVSHRRKINHRPEIIMEKIKPHLQIAGKEVYIPAGTFLQPSKAGEQVLINLVIKYLGNMQGKIADLFCGVGTFSYAVAKNGVQVLAIDSSEELLTGFQESLNKQMIMNIQIENRNLFKYPLAGKELYGFDAIVFDPPRAGAKEQVTAITALDSNQKPQKIIAVSCNPHSFVRDANILIDGGYCLKKITIVDQFIYSPHSELVALFVSE